MLKRYLILLGAQTDAGGTVKTATSFMSYSGLPYALEGDLVDCPACGQQGSIECVAPRLDARYNGKQYALEHDLCVCGCSPPPRRRSGRRTVPGRCRYRQEILVHLRRRINKKSHAPSGSVASSY